MLSRIKMEMRDIIVVLSCIHIQMLNWFAFLSILIATVTLGFCFFPRVVERSAGDESEDSGVRWRAWAPDLLAWLLAVWMLVAALGSCPPGNLRQATNEAWLWVSAAAVFTAARRLLANASARRAVFTLLIVGSCGLAVHAMHQYWVSLPQARARYLKALFELGGERSGQAPNGRQLEELSRLRHAYEEMAHAARALETAIQRGYLDVRPSIR